MVLQRSITQAMALECLERTVHMLQVEYYMASGNSMYMGGYGGLYGAFSMMYGAVSLGMYGGGMYNSDLGGPMGGCGMDMGGPYEVKIHTSIYFSSISTRVLDFSTLGGKHERL